MSNLYKDSWELYRQHTDGFEGDLDYYYSFCKSHSTLELFAGYGRVSNYLRNRGVDVETIELSQEFSDLIQLPHDKRHVGDVTKLVLNKSFDRIFAAYNSFCLLTADSQLHAFFSNMRQMLNNSGLISLSYYHPDQWSTATGYEIEFKGQSVFYQPDFDLSRRGEKRGIWRDRYVFPDGTVEHEYPVRIFEDESDLLPFIEKSGLTLVKIVRNYNNPNISESGWVEYILSL